MTYDEHDSDCRSWNGGMHDVCTCLSGARRRVSELEAAAAQKQAQAAAARKPVDDAYERGRADERAEWEHRMKAMEARLAAIESAPKPPRGPLVFR